MSKRVRMKKSIRKYFFTGLLILVPLYITGYVFVLIVNFMDSFVRFMPVALRPETYLPFRIPGMGLLITLVGVFIVGVLAQNLLGKKLVEFGELLLAKIPIIRAVYKGTKQFMETFFMKDRDGFRRVVLIEYPRKGIHSIAFVTGKTSGELRTKTGEPALNLFIPTTPNPTSGYYIVVPEKDIRPLDMDVEDAFKIIMTAGMVVPAVGGEAEGEGDGEDKPDSEDRRSANS